MVASFVVVFGALVGGSSVGLVVVTAAADAVAVVPAAAVGLTLRKLVGGWAEDSTLDLPLGQVALEKRDASQE